MLTVDAHFALKIGFVYVCDAVNEAAPSEMQSINMQVTTEQGFTCDYCNHNFGRKFNLKQHMNTNLVTEDS